MKEIKKITQGRIARQYKLLKLGLGAGRNLLQSSGQELTDKFKDAINTEVHKIVNDLGLMKGSVMKVGQMLSLYSDSILPPEVKEVLKELEGKSFYLNWQEIQKNIPASTKEHIDITHTPIAAASLGQVHKGTIRESGEKVAIKIQYNGVKKAIANDIKTLKLILKLAKVLPKGKKLDPFFTEIKKMLEQETDYVKERTNHQLFADLLKDDKSYYVPKIYEDYCDEKVIVSEFIDAPHLRELSNSNLSLEDRNKLGLHFFDLFMREIFKWGVIQTDPNPANYLIRKHKGEYQWVLLDFGATKEIPDSVQDNYHRLIFAVINQKMDEFVELLFELKYLQKDSSFNKELFQEYLSTVSEPFSGGVYNWGESDIPERMLKLAPKVVKELTIDQPPQDIVFIDRKIGGIFFVLKELKCEFDPNLITDNYQDLNPANDE
jgi:predicted unusual protein kinase regulating ubiquinone biosynthesis (AarF/ABC1/UbiB family)